MTNSFTCYDDFITRIKKFKLSVISYDKIMIEIPTNVMTWVTFWFVNLLVSFFSSKLCKSIIHNWFNVQITTNCFGQSCRSRSQKCFLRCTRISQFITYSILRWNKSKLWTRFVFSLVVKIGFGMFLFACRWYINRSDPVGNE